MIYVLEAVPSRNTAATKAACPTRLGPSIGRNNQTFPQARCMRHYEAASVAYFTGSYEI